MPALAHAPPSANAVRIPIAWRSGRVVQIRFTDFARQRSPFRLHTLFGPTPEAAVAKILDELNCDAEALRLRSMQAGDVAVLRTMPEHAPPELGPSAVRPVAFVEGLTDAELAAALASVQAAAIWGTPFDFGGRP